MVSQLDPRDAMTLHRRAWFLEKIAYCIEKLISEKINDARRHQQEIMSSDA